MEIVGLAAGNSVEALARQAREFNVRSVCIFHPSGADELARALPGAQVETGEEGLCRLAQLPEDVYKRQSLRHPPYSSPF